MTPVQNQVQRIETNSGIGSTIFLRSSSTPGSVNAGTIEMDNVADYQNLYAGTLSVATMSFGSFSGGIFNRATVMYLGDAPDGTQRMTWVGSGALNAFHAGGAKPLAFTPILTGSASITFGKITGMNSGAADIQIGRIRDGTGTLSSGFISASLSDYTGGSIVQEEVLLTVAQSSAVSSGTISNGPLGRGTVTLDGGTLLLGERDASTILHNAIKLTANSAIITTGGPSGSAFPTRSLAGPVLLQNHQLLLNLQLFGLKPLIFDNTTFSSSDSGTIAFAASPFDTRVAEFAVSSGVSNTFGGAIGVLSGTNELNGTAIKTGTGTLQALHYRVKSLAVDEGVLRVAQEGTSLFGGGGNVGVSRVQDLALAGGSSPTVKLDLGNSEFIIDYDGTSPAGTIRSQVMSGYAGGSWNGNGIISSTIAATSGSANFGVGYAEASHIGVTNFGSLSVDSSAVLLKPTYRGDASLDGLVGLDDFTLLGTGFGQSGTRWDQGDFNYDGDTNLDDFTILAANFGITPQLQRGGAGLAPLGYLYIAMLDYPEIYWGAKFREDIWWRFAEFEAMNLGTPPALPESMRSSIPEPAFGAFALLAVAGLMNRFRRRG